MLIVVALAVLITFQLTYIRVNNKYEKALNEIKDTQLLYDKLASVDAAYRTNFVGEIDEKTLIDTVLQGYVIGTGDKYGAYFDKERFNEILSDTNAEFVGIGINAVYDSELGAIHVVNVIPDSPAFEAGLMPGDLITHVKGEAVGKIGYSMALNEIKGKEKTKVSITVLRDSSYIDYEIERRKVTDYTVYHRVYSADKTVGIVQILSFDAGTAQQFKAAVKELIEKGVNKLVFDVRNNPGGNLESIEEVLDYLLPEGTIIRIYDASGNEEVLASDAECIDVPMMVLVNSNTASAAELFASALRDYGKAKLIGETTFGKGTMQTVIPLYDGSAISVSSSMYAPPVSDNYEGVGLSPDIRVELPEEVKNKSVFLITDNEDTQLITAIKEFSNN